MKSRISVNYTKHVLCSINLHVFENGNARKVKSQEQHALFHSGNDLIAVK
jgi:hypothetical protein